MTKGTNMDKLLEDNLSGEPPRPAYRARVLLDSTAAFAQARRSRAHWRLAASSAAAVLLVGVSFLVGRCSLGPLAPQMGTGPVVASDTVVVPKDLVACVSAARLFKQLGMEDRMNRALDCAGRLLPREAIAGDGTAGPVFFAASGDGIESQTRRVELGPKPGLPQSAESTNRVLAGFLGGYDHASRTN